MKALIQLVFVIPIDFKCRYSERLSSGVDYPRRLQQRYQDKAKHSQQDKYEKSDPVASRNIEGASGHQRSGRTADRAAG